MLLFRCDAGPSIGAGHFYRDFAIAQAASIHGEPSVFVCASLPEPMRQELVDISATLILIESEVGSQEDLKETLEICRSYQPRFVFVDGYRFSPDYAKSLDVTYPTVVIDDLGEQRWDVSAIVNVNIYAPELEYEVPQRTLLLLGIEFALLRKDFRVTQNLERDSRRIFVTMGGGDVEDLAALVFKGLEDIDDLEVDVMLGAAYPYYERLGKLAKNQTARVRLHRNVSNPAEVIRGATLAVSSAGGTTWELACLGVPSLHVIAAENQRRVAQATQALGMTELLGDWKSIDPGTIKTHTLALLDDKARMETMSAKCVQTVDGRGPLRVLAALQTLEGP